MALTVDFLGTVFDSAESATPWSTGALDPDFYVQGSNSLGWYAAKNGRASITCDAADISWSTGDHLYFWMNSSVAAKSEPQSTGTTTASGLTVRVTLANAAYREWHVAGSDTWDGGWRCFVAELDYSTGDQLFASSGTFSTASQIASITFYFDLSNSGNIRNVPANMWNDRISIGSGLRAYNTSAADPSFGFSEIAAVDEAVANRWGVLETKDGVVFSQGELICGDTTNHIDFDSQDEVFVFSNRDGTDGEGFVGSSLYSLTFNGNATGSDQDVNFGIKVGTGDTASGRNGSILRAAGSMLWSFDLSNSNVHNFTMYGSTVQGARNGISVTGSPTTLFEVVGDTFDTCEQIDTSDAEVRNCNVLNTIAAATSGAFLWTNGTTDAKYMLFVNNAVAVEVPTLSGNMTFVGMEFQGNTFDVRYEGASNYNLQWSEASAAPSVQNAGAGTLTPTASVGYTLTNINNPSEVTILDRDVSLLSVTGTESSQNIGDVAANTQAGQSFQAASAGEADRLRMNVWKSGSPTDSLRARLVNGVPGTRGFLSMTSTSNADIDYVKANKPLRIESGSGDVTVIARVRFDLPQATNSYILSNTGTGSLGKMLSIVESSGSLYFIPYDQAGASTTFGVTHGLTTATWYWLKYDYDYSAGAVDFSQSTDSALVEPENVSWTAIGTQQTGTARKIVDQGDQPFYIGANEDLAVFSKMDIAYLGVWRDGTEATGQQTADFDLRYAKFDTDVQLDGTRKFDWQLQTTSTTKPTFTQGVFDDVIVSTGTDLPSTSTELEVQFNVREPLATATTYGIELYRTGANSGTDYYITGYDTTSVHASGSRYLFNTSWASQTGDLLFSVMDSPGSNELYHVENVTTGTTTYTHDGTTKSIEVLVADLTALQTVIIDSIGGSDKSQAVFQVPDLVYANN